MTKSAAGAVRSSDAAEEIGSPAVDPLNGLDGWHVVGSGPPTTLRLLVRDVDEQPSDPRYISQCSPNSAAMRRVVHAALTAALPLAMGRDRFQPSNEYFTPD